MTSPGGDGGYVPRFSGLKLGGSSVRLGSAVTHQPTWIPKSTWVRWKSIDVTTNENETIEMNI
ncbi:MAG: hypothetical protein QW290_01980 [Sulfolobales archaeon]